MAPATDPSDARSAGSERGLWSGSAENGWMPLVLVLVLGHGAVVNLLLDGGDGVGPFLNVAHLALLAVLELFARVRVRLDARGLAIRYGYLGWLRQRIPLERVSAARAFRLEPLEHGGWGYRGSMRFSGRAAVVVRAGSALGLDLEQGKRFSITVDDAGTAALQINTLLARRISPPAGSNADTVAGG